jgi:DNA-binding response OmpR family regulator
MQATESAGHAGRVMIVDDNKTIRLTMSMVLSERFEVCAVDSGEACVAALAHFAPDLVLLDIEMNGMNGHQTCRQMRADGHTMPVIFVSSHDDLEERLKAFDSGGEDFVVKPFDAELLVRRSESSIRSHAERVRLKKEMDSTRELAFGFLKSVGEAGVLLEFVQKSLTCRDDEELARRIVGAGARLDVRCHVHIRHAEGNVYMTPDGPATPLESSILERSAGLGRIFEFRSRLVINYPAVTVLVIDLPDDPDVTGRLRDNLAVLTESADLISGMLGVRRQAVARATAIDAAAQESIAAVEALRNLYRRQQGETTVQLETLIGAVENTYLFLGLTDRQEATINATLRQGADGILQLFNLDDEFDRHFGRVLKLLRP